STGRAGVDGVNPGPACDASGLRRPSLVRLDVSKVAGALQAIFPRRNTLKADVNHTLKIQFRMVEFKRRFRCKKVLHRGTADKTGRLNLGITSTQPSDPKGIARVGRAAEPARSSSVDSECASGRRQPGCCSADGRLA